MKSTLLAALALSLSAAAHAEPVGGFDYDMCGTLVPGVTCPALFQDTAGDLWLLEEYGPFGLGDFVHVVGTSFPSCASICNQGNGCIEDNTIAVCGSIDTPFCFCDPISPCGNTDPSAGCANSSGAGATLASSGSASVGADDLSFQAAGLLANQPALLFVGDDALNNGDGLLFGDGLRCAGSNVVRLGTRTPDAMGAASWGPGLGAQAGWSSGDVRRFQVWYRDPAGGGACGSSFNLTHGLEITFTL